MPVITDSEIIDSLRKQLETSSINIDSETRERAKKQSEEYFKNNHQLVDNPIPHAFYYIISELSEDEQITFITNHLNFIEKHDEEIFLYKYMNPESLSYFLSSKVIDAIHDISPMIFEKLITNNIAHLFNGFSHQEYLEFYRRYIHELSNLNNNYFIAGIFNHKHWRDKEYYQVNIENGLIDLTAEINQKAIQDLEFITLILKEYSHKIDTFSSSELLSFLNHLDDSKLLNDLIIKYHSKLVTTFTNISTQRLKDIISEYDSQQQKIIFDKFYNIIISHHSFSSLIEDLNTKIVIDLCLEHPELLSFLTIEDWLKITVCYPITYKKLPNILDNYELTDPSILFKNINSRFKDEHPSYEVCKYLELKYRHNLKITNYLFPINDTTSLFSKEFIHNLNELYYLFKEHQINKTSPLYQQHLLIFINYMKSKISIDNPDDLTLKIIDTVFYRIVKGAPLSDLYNIFSIEGLAILSRLGEIPFVPQEFTVNQLLTYNVKHYKKLTEKYQENCYLTSYQTLILKLMLLVGYHHAKNILSINDKLPVLEHLIGPINIESITFDKQGNPILNQKIINLLFSDKDYSQIKYMLTNQDSDLYKYFPRIFNEWENLKINHKDTSLKSVLGYLKGDNVTVSPEYYRLEGLFKHIGSTAKLINETFKLHNQMLARTSSTIPRVTGKVGEYSYEVLKLHDMEGLTVGNQTDCCFTIRGVSSSSLKHATTSPNGRIFVIKKDNQLIAHSWLWRNGDLLCFDNIEVAKGIQTIDFFDIYLEAISKILNISAENESPETCLKNITIGRTSFDIPCPALDKYLCLKLSNKNYINSSNVLVQEKLPEPLEKVSYSDAKYSQYLIVGTANFNFGEITPCYQDARSTIMHYQFNQSYSNDYLKMLSKKLNSLTYLKAKHNNQLESYELIDINDFQEIYCNDDWYYIIYKNGQTDEFIYSFDERANLEMKTIPCQSTITKKLIKC